MLNQEQIDAFFKGLEGDVPKPVDFDEVMAGEMRRGCDLTPEELRDYSDHFDIPVEALRKLSAWHVFLLVSEWVATTEEPHSFEFQQMLDEHDREVEKAGGAAKYWDWMVEERKKRKAPIPSSPIFPLSPKPGQTRN